ncbi:mRNA-decapping enzyme 1A-like isoform X2 [Stylophora pistillata]|uniref:mRNA-decapping enzyme 1B n=1 Tax=Stylophora pistillata TaxID=50429 RepID=A0A2B4RFS2_STYPI|nr:mRNA-decapping enzyme 1A-like isoform X2 [Stylophora pistillata]PFX17214.1 mRNA-decapping enzyme 1B [Stylophora pistillata]
MAAKSVASSLNLTAIKKSDQYVMNILDNASQVALYKFNGETQAWEKTEVEGALFVYKRSATPTSAFFIMNRLNMKNMMEPITNSMEFKLQDPFLLYRNSAKEIFGIWFYDVEECKRLAGLMTMISSQMNALGSATVTPPKPSYTQEMPKESQKTTSEEKVDIMQLFAKAQEKYNNQSKASSASTAATHTVNTPSRPQILPEHREHQQSFLQQNQQQLEQLQKLFQTDDRQPKKQRAYSTPVPYLLGNLSPSSLGKGPSKGAEQQNGVSPGAEGQTSKKNLKMKSLPLSDVKAPVSSGTVKSTQDDSAVIEQGKGGAQRKLFHNEKAEAKSAAMAPVTPTVPPQTTLASQTKDSPQKSQQDQGGAAAASLMSPLAFKSSGKVTVLTPAPPPPPQPKQPPTMDIAPLTQEQLVQALTYLLKNDSEFVAKIHEAYFKSLMEKLPT